MAWPPQVGPARRRKRKKKSNGAGARASCENAGTSIVISAKSYSCHYCARTNGTRTRDHMLPRKLGGTGAAANIVRCCHMCNVIKAAREYVAFMAFFGEFLREHGEEYRAADPDHGKSIRDMSRKFTKWLRALQEMPRGAERPGTYSTAPALGSFETAVMRSGHSTVDVASVQVIAG